MFDFKRTARRVNVVSASVARPQRAAAKSLHTKVDSVSRPMSLLRTRSVKRICVALALLCTLDATSVSRVAAQSTDARRQQQSAPPVASAGRITPEQRPLRLERLPVAGGAELLTIFGAAHPTLPVERSAGSSDSTRTTNREVPLVSVLRDTMGDGDPANDILRDVWMHAYARPSLRQRLLAAVPFLYTNRLSRTKVDDGGVPPRLIDLANAERDVWERFIWTALQLALVNPQGFAVRAPVNYYRRNTIEHRKAYLIRALGVLSLYEMTRRDEDSGELPPALSDLELAQISGRLALAENLFGGVVDDINLQRVHARRSANTFEVRGRNWELLRQQAERNGLYFEPLSMPDGSAMHALLWVAAEDLEPAGSRQWHKRFLSIKNPWRDRGLRRWKGYTETWSFDREDIRINTARDDRIDELEPGESVSDVARTRRMIPLALYGLDHPKVPALLVDFRDDLNPKRRELSRRVLRDVARDVLQIGRFGSVYYFFGRSIYDYVTNRRGADLNQPSRLRAYSELKLLLSLDASLDPALRDEIANRADSVSSNPIDTSAIDEAALARKQYAALIAYAGRADGLPARLARDRRGEARNIKSSRADRVMHRLAGVASLGVYDARPKMTPERASQIDIARRLRHHTTLLREVAREDSPVEIRWDIADVRRSLEFIAEHGTRADANAAKAAANIFRHTADDDTRSLAVRCLYRINHTEAKRLLLRIEADEALPARWRDMSRDLLRTALREEQHFTSQDLARAQTLVGVDAPTPAMPNGNPL